MGWIAGIIADHAERAEPSALYIADLLVAGVGGDIVGVGVEHGNQPCLCHDAGDLVDQLLGVMLPAVPGDGIDAADAAQIAAGAE